jgi:hypothetical protein
VLFSVDNRGDCVSAGHAVLPCCAVMLCCHAVMLCCNLTCQSAILLLPQASCLHLRPFLANA